MRVLRGGPIIAGGIVICTNDFIPFTRPYVDILALHEKQPFEHLNHISRQQYVCIYTIVFVYFTAPID